MGTPLYSQMSIESWPFLLCNIRNSYFSPWDLGLCSDSGGLWLTHLMQVSQITTHNFALIPGGGGDCSGLTEWQLVGYSEVVRSGDCYKRRAHPVREVLRKNYSGPLEKPSTYPVGNNRKVGLLKVRGQVQVIMSIDTQQI